MLQNMVQLWGCRCGWFQSSKDIYHVIHLKQLLRRINMPGKGGGEACSRCGWWFPAKE